jgi:hypothetical protein
MQQQRGCGKQCSLWVCAEDISGELEYSKGSVRKKNPLVVSLED